MPLFCAYCGKSFTRKEHLERHIPTHTNVKPYRCEFCQMSFARKDLLNRHTTTYHEPASYMEPVPGVVPAVSGRTPIACQNCATAKTGCDKRVPCSRCAEKGLPCEARYARRSMKAALRAAQVTAAYNQQLAVQSQRDQTQQGLPGQLAGIDIELRRRQSSRSESEALSPHVKMIPREATQHLMSSPQAANGAEPFSASTGIDGVEELMPFHGDFPLPDPTYQDFMAWPDFAVDFDMYGHNLPIMGTDAPATAFTQLSDVSSSSDPTSSSSRRSTHTRGTSVVDLDAAMKPLNPIAGNLENAMMSEFDPVIASEPAWPLARCNPPIFSGTCPQTAIIHLENLERSKDELIWAPLETYMRQIEWDESDLESVVPMTARSRDRMLAIAQSFLHKALDIHRRGLNDVPRAGHPSPGSFNFIVLPPTRLLDFFLRNFVRSMSHYFPLTVSSRVDPNDLVINDQASTLLVLLMVAQGATTVPRAESQDLATGLTETCRLSLFDIIEKDVGLSANPVVLRCALLFTVLGAWSGDKWLMDIAMGQRGMYLAMLKHSGMLEPQQPTIPVLNNCTSTELQWRTWLHRESRNRLVYNWVMIDQELSLFHDTAPTLSFTDLKCPLPSPEGLWKSPDANQWFENIQTLYGSTMNVNPQLLSNTFVTPSLHHLFQDLLHDDLVRRQDILSPQQLRLLLHPLQSMVWHLRQMLSCFPDARRPTVNGITRSGTISRFEEVKAVLQKWYGIANMCQKANHECQTTRVSLVLYHLISLNVAVDFLEMERLARREDLEDTFWDLSGRYTLCISNRDDAVFHCGQIFRLLRLISADRRPCWWAAAAYRGTLILWTDAIARLERGFHKQWTQPSPQISPSDLLQTFPASGDPSLGMPASSLSGTATVPIDHITSESQMHDCIAVLTRRDGSTVSLDKPQDILGYGVMLIDEAPCTRIGEGLKRKLAALGQNWGTETPGGLTV